LRTSAHAIGGGAKNRTGLPRAARRGGANGRCRPTVIDRQKESARAKDGNIRVALLDRFGGEKVAKGTKAEPRPLYGVSGHS